mgnify:CR=1 FL=1
MPTGKVKWYDAEKGFGFISGDDGEDVFLHVNDIDFDESALRPGTAVTFDVEKGDKGLKAERRRRRRRARGVVGAPSRQP